MFPKKCCDNNIFRGKYPSFTAGMDSWAVCLNSWAIEISTRVSKEKCPCPGQGVGARWALNSFQPKPVCESGSDKWKISCDCWPPLLLENWDPREPRGGKYQLHPLYTKLFTSLSPSHCTSCKNSPWRRYRLMEWNCSCSEGLVCWRRQR